MTLFTGASHWVLYWTNWIHSRPSFGSILIPLFHLHLGLSCGLFTSRYSTETLYTFLSPRRATCPTHLIRLIFFCLTIHVDEYKSWSFSLCNFLRSHVTWFCLHSQDYGFVYFNIYIARQEGGRPNYRNHLHNRYNIYNWMVVSPPNPTAWGSHLADCTRLLIRYTASYLPYLKAVSPLCNLTTRNSVDKGPN
jgi:hypothetical protein